MSRMYSLKVVQKIPVGLDTAWNFFSKPANLKDITPGVLGFQIISEHHGDSIYPGQIIEYKLRPILKISVYWMTEITHVHAKEYFIDEQRFGPYSFWHHQHHFKPISNGVEMTDIIHYKIPFWLAGDMINSLVVKHELKKIFTYRFTVISKTLGEWPGQQISERFFG